MAKDVIFDNAPKTKTKKVLALPYRPYRQEAMINLYTHSRLLDNEIVEKGDEYLALGKWYPAGVYSVGHPAGHLFVFRRKLKKS
jgi:hypothetical protein